MSTLFLVSPWISMGWNVCVKHTHIQQNPLDTPHPHNCLGQLPQRCLGWEQKHPQSDKDVKSLIFEYTYTSNLFTSINFIYNWFHKCIASTVLSTLQARMRKSLKKDYIIKYSVQNINNCEDNSNDCDLEVMMVKMLSIKTLKMVAICQK